MKLTIPQGGPGFGFLEFAIHVLDHSPVYETRAQMRLGYKAIDAIEAAVKASESEAVLDDEAGKLFQKAAEATPIPRLYLMIDGKQGDAVPARFYTPFYEAAEKAE